MVSEKETKTLSGEDALELWRQGKDIWNEWVEDNPEYNIDFSDVDFSKERTGANPTIDFTEFEFPKGLVSFERARFGEGDVLFTLANFGKGDVTFFKAQFGEGLVAFQYAEFGDGDVCFDGTQFGGGGVSFYWTKFGLGNLSFCEAEFGEGTVNFNGAQLGDGDVNFSKVFVKGHIEFNSLLMPELIRRLHFKGAEFCKTFVFSENVFDCVVDLTNTKVSHHVSLDDVSCNFRSNKNSWWDFWKLRKAKDGQDAERFRRLKELAEDNKHHEAALEFHAQELRASRWQNKRYVFRDVLDLTYDAVSNYGRSVFRPVLLLLVNWTVFAKLYYDISLGKDIDSISWWYESLAFSAGQLLPIVPGARFAQAEGAELLFGGDLPPLVIGLTFLETSISLVLIFLIGLALRNRFRI